MEENREIALVNRAKVAYLYTKANIYEERIDLIERNGQQMYAFIFKLTDIVKQLLKEYDAQIELKKYNSNFKNIALAIKKKQMEGI